jgi:hypothetical protein
MQFKSQKITVLEILGILWLLGMALGVLAFVAKSV